MKVGIITFHDSDNYGAALQVYALHKIVGQGNQCEIIDYHSDAVSADCKIEKIRFGKGLKGKLKKLYTLRYYEDRHASFVRFLSNCNISKKYNAQTIREANKCYDAFITGSDQVFNLALTHGDRNYLLDFAEDSKLKIAYAASMGKYKFCDGDFKTQEDILRLDAISCREPEVVQKVEKITGRTGELVLDPTLLLKKEEWQEMEEVMPNIPERYILLYCVSPENWYFRLAAQASKEYGLPVLYINYSPRRIHLYGIKNLLKVTPGQFVYLIHNASIVLTSSFHGTALSMIYKKDIYIINDITRTESNQRMERLIDLYGLNHRFISSAEDFEHSAFNYEHGEVRLESEREKSICFLKKTGMLKGETSI